MMVRGILLSLLISLPDLAQKLPMKGVALRGLHGVTNGKLALERLSMQFELAE